MAGRMLAAARGNAHVFNYVVFGAATLIPVLLYANMRSPNQDQIEAALKEEYSSDVAKVRENTEKINSFWKAKRNSVEMDQVYAELLRSGRSSVKRHYELSGSLSDAEALQNPQYAQLQRILSLPPTEEEKAAVAAAAPPPAADNKGSAKGAAGGASPHPAAGTGMAVESTKKL